jgi:hypothetical protein
MILIAGYGGLRVGELAGLKVGHVNELTRRIAAISGGVMTASLRARAWAKQHQCTGWCGSARRFSPPHDLA